MGVIKMISEEFREELIKLCLKYNYYVNDMSVQKKIDSKTTAGFERFKIVLKGENKAR